MRTAVAPGPVLSRETLPLGDVIGRRIRKVLLIGPALLLVIGVSTCGRQGPHRYLVLATTTSVGNSGLLDVVLTTFERQHAIRIRAHLVGSGLALKMLEKADADAVISHAPSAEMSALRSHGTWRYRKIMLNDFVIVGPPDDPARTSGAPDARDAMRRIAVSGAKFLSRGDHSGTHEREEALWRTAGARPAAGKLIVAGAGMGSTLRVASQTAAYTLADRASFTQLASTVQLTIVYEGGSELLNTYAVIIDGAGPRALEAALFFDWLGGDVGRTVIEDYRVRGSQVFFAWPQERSSDRPDALPR